LASFVFSSSVKEVGKGKRALVAMPHLLFFVKVHNAIETETTPVQVTDTKTVFTHCSCPVPIWQQREFTSEVGMSDNIKFHINIRGGHWC
jgi:hypothetical protein